MGTAGWSIPAAVRHEFPDAGTMLERYAARFNAVEINSSFHRPHRRSTWERWAASVPAEFRFAVKLPKTITHERRLVDVDALLEQFAMEVGGLGARLGPVLVQLPPSLIFVEQTAAGFFDRLQGELHAACACEPRHPSWFTPQADALLTGLRVARVAADPARCPEAALPGGWRGLIYARWHGSPAMYRSSYAAAALAAHADLARLGDSWTFYDNTMLGAATADALGLSALLG